MADDPATQPSTSHRRELWLRVGIVVSAVVVLAGVVSLVLLGRSSHRAGESVAQARAQAARVGLRSSDLSSSWGADNPATAPLSGLLGTAPSTKVTALDRQMTTKITKDYQTCVGLNDAHDRFFGKAGVQPLAQVPSLPFSLTGSAGVVEVGTATQRYASTNDVEADQKQAARPAFASCLSQTMGRFVLSGAGAKAIVATPGVTAQHLSAPLGVFVTGASAELSYPSPGGATPIEVGTTLLIAGHDEQYLYTFTSPGTFSDHERQVLIDILGARLAAASAESV